jgi:hypothetical protein
MNSQPNRGIRQWHEEHSAHLSAVQRGRTLLYIGCINFAIGLTGILSSLLHHRSLTGWAIFTATGVLVVLIGFGSKKYGLYRLEKDPFVLPDPKNSPR